MGSDTLATFRTMLDRPVPVEDALIPYLGTSAVQANQDADGDHTHDGLLRRRLHDLVLLLALREADPAIACTAAALVWRSAPIAQDVDELVAAIRAICEWRSALSDADVARIATSHLTYERLFDNLMDTLDDPTDPAFDDLMEAHSRSSEGDHVVAELGDQLMIIEMTATDYLVGLLGDNGDIIVIDRVPHTRGGGGWSDGGGDPVAPGPRILQDA